MYLSQSDLHSTKVVVIPEVGGGVVDVVNAQLQILHRLKVVVESETLAEGRTGGVLQSLCASKLVVREKQKERIKACPLHVPCGVCVCACVCAGVYTRLPQSICLLPASAAAHTAGQTLSRHLCPADWSRKR